MSSEEKSPVTPERISVLRAAVARKPDADEFGELAELLSLDPTARAEAREVCFRGLRANPSHRIGRLALARAFYLDGMYEFSVRELIELRRQMGVSIPSIDKLIAAFGPLATQFEMGAVKASAGTESHENGETDANTESSDATVMAELDIDTDFLEVLGDLEDEK